MVDNVHQGYLGCLKIKLNPSLLMEKHVLDHGVWEAPSVWVIDNLVQPGDTCVDVGASAGLLTLAMAKRAGASGKVFAFEPGSVSYGRLIDNINLNPELRSYVVAEKFAISDHDEFARLYQQGDGNARILGKADSESGRSIDEGLGELCLTTSLDKILSANRLDFLKIDVEGMEIEVLKGASQLIRRHKPFIWYESELRFEWFDKERVRACELFLLELGYQLFKVSPDAHLVPVAYPDYDVNSLGAPDTKLDSIKHLMAQ